MTKNLIQQKGDALIVHKCASILNFVIKWNHKINSTCYYDPPVFINSSIVTNLTSLRFLNINARTLQSNSHKIDCNKRTDFIFVEDILGSLWKIDVRNEELEKVKYRRMSLISKRLFLPQIGHFNKHLLHYENKPNYRMTLLQIVENNKENLNELKSSRTKGNGDILSGFGSLMGELSNP